MTQVSLECDGTDKPYHEGNKFSGYIHAGADVKAPIVQLLAVLERQVDLLVSCFEEQTMGTIKLPCAYDISNVDRHRGLAMLKVEV